MREEEKLARDVYLTLDEYWGTQTSNLLDGSRNHLRAFVGVIEDQGLVYEAQVLDADEVRLVLESGE